MAPVDHLLPSGHGRKIGIIGAGDIGGTWRDGTLAESWRQQPGTPVYGADLGAAGVRAPLAAAQAGRAPEWRAGG